MIVSIFMGYLKCFYIQTWVCLFSTIKRKRIQNCAALNLNRRRNIYVIIQTTSLQDKTLEG